jgi:hypothetical protein
LSFAMLPFITPMAIPWWRLVAPADRNMVRMHGSLAASC